MFVWVYCVVVGCGLRGCVCLCCGWLFCFVVLVFDNVGIDYVCLLLWVLLRSLVLVVGLWLCRARWFAVWVGLGASLVIIVFWWLAVF